MNKKWLSYYHAMARQAATMSKDSTQVGAILVDPEGAIILTAYNGPPKGVKDHPVRFERPTKYLFASHAEQNLIAFAARRGIPTLGCSIFVTHCPCCDCAKSIIQSGIKNVYYGPGETSMDIERFDATRVMFAEAGINVTFISDNSQPAVDIPDNPS